MKSSRRIHTFRLTNRQCWFRQESTTIPETAVVRKDKAGSPPDLLYQQELTKTKEFQPLLHLCHSQTCATYQSNQALRVVSLKVNISSPYVFILNYRVVSRCVPTIACQRVNLGRDFCDSYDSTCTDPSANGVSPAKSRSPN